MNITHNQYLIIYNNYDYPKTSIIFAENEHKALIEFCLSNYEDLDSELWFNLDIYYKDDLIEYCNKLKGLKYLKQHIQIVRIDDIQESCNIGYKYTGIYETLLEPIEIKNKLRLN